MQEPGFKMVNRNTVDEQVLSRDHKCKRRFIVWKKTARFKSMTFICGTCGKELKRKWGLVLHERGHAGHVRYYCCEKAYPHKDALTGHRCTEHGDPRKYKCKKCSTSFPTRDDLSKHEKRETIEKRFTCDICGLKLRQEIDLKANMDIHTGEKSFVCDTCGKRYRHRSSLSKHKSAKH